MKFEEVLPALREGKEIKYIAEDRVYTLNQEVIESYNGYIINTEMLLSDSWEIVEEPKYRWARIKLCDNGLVIATMTESENVTKMQVEPINGKWIGDWVKYEAK